MALFPEVMEVLTRETLKADPLALGRIMADHTQVLLTLNQVHGIGLILEV